MMRGNKGGTGSAPVVTDLTNDAGTNLLTSDAGNQLTAA